VNVNGHRSGNDQSPQLGELRRAAGLSQQQLAERAKCSLSTVALFERGYTPKRSATLVRLLDVLVVESRS
jgi:transcriptional regulator with XRE-family HTH domain